MDGNVTVLCTFFVYFVSFTIYKLDSNCINFIKQIYELFINYTITLPFLRHEKMVMGLVWYIYNMTFSEITFEMAFLNTPNILKTSGRYKFMINYKQSVIINKLHSLKYSFQQIKASNTTAVIVVRCRELQNS